MYDPEFNLEIGKLHERSRASIENMKLEFGAGHPYTKICESIQMFWK